MGKQEIRISDVDDRLEATASRVAALEKEWGFVRDSVFPSLAQRFERLEAFLGSGFSEFVAEEIGRATQWNEDVMETGKPLGPVASREVFEALDQCRVALAAAIPKINDETLANAMEKARAKAYALIKRVRIPDGDPPDPESVEDAESR